MATRWRVLNRRRARKARSPNQPERARRFEEVSRCDHQWDEEYYGHRCKKCDLFYAHGNAPWDYYSDEPGTDYVAAWLDGPYEGDDEPPEAFMEGICGDAGMYTCLCAGDFCACGIETIICEGCIDCAESRI